VIPRGLSSKSRKDGTGGRNTRGREKGKQGQQAQKGRTPNGGEIKHRQEDIKLMSIGKPHFAPSWGGRRNGRTLRIEIGANQNTSVTGSGKRGAKGGRGGKKEEGGDKQ